MKIIGQINDVNPDSQTAERFYFGDVLTVCTSYERLLLIEVETRWGRNGAEQMLHLLRSMTSLDQLLQTLAKPNPDS
jgi:hypothetical protein